VRFKQALLADQWQCSNVHLISSAKADVMR